MSFLEALNQLSTKGVGFRMHRESKPGLVLWLVHGVLEANGSLCIHDFNGTDWLIIQDDTVIR